MKYPEHINLGPFYKLFNAGVMQRHQEKPLDPETVEALVNKIVAAEFDTIQKSVSRIAAYNKSLVANC